MVENVAFITPMATTVIIVTILPFNTTRSAGRSAPCTIWPTRKALRACFKIAWGPAARDFDGGQGGESGASPQRAVTGEPTPAGVKRAAARRVFVEKAAWLRCSSVTDRWRVCSLVAPRHAAFSAKTGPHGILKHALRARAQDCGHRIGWPRIRNRSNCASRFVVQAEREQWRRPRDPRRAHLGNTTKSARKRSAAVCGAPFEHCVYLVFMFTKTKTTHRPANCRSAKIDQGKQAQFRSSSKARSPDLRKQHHRRTQTQGHPQRPGCRGPQKV